MRFGTGARTTLAVKTVGKRGSASVRFLSRRGVQVGIAFAVIVSLAVGVAVRVLPAQAQQHAPVTLPSTVYGPNIASVQAAVNAAQWPQQKSNWCGIATIAAIDQYRHLAVSQQDVVNYLNSDAGVSEWGTPSTVPNEGPGFRGDIARDLGSDPRSLAASLTGTAQGTYHQVVALKGSYDATLHLVADLLRSNEPISVIVYHGFHSVLVSGVVATGNPLTNPGSITGFEVWDPGVGVPDGNIQPDEEDFVSLSTWLNSQYYWGSPYAANFLGSLALDPDPAVGPYTNNPSQGNNGHLWIGHYVYLRPDASTDAFASLSPDWAIDPFGAVIMGFHGEVPTDYTGVTSSIPIVTQLGETSFDAPAFWSKSENPLATSATFNPATVLGWVGTDAAHHLNVSASGDGIHYGSKVTLGETSFTRPSLIVVPNATNTANIVVISWAGNDARHSLNVLYDVYGARTKVTFNETSRFAPSLAYFKGQIWMTWTGTDAAHTLNTRSLGPKGLTLGPKKTLWGDSSNVTPNLALDQQNNQLLLTWQMSGSNRLNLLKSADGVNWGGILDSASGQTSGYTPSLVAINPPPDGAPAYFWGWTGTDSTHSLNIQSATAPNAWSPVSNHGLSCLGAPMLGAIGQPHQLVLAVTGTDSAHHIYVASIPV